MNFTPQYKPLPVSFDAHVDRTPRPCKCGCGRLVVPDNRNDVYFSLGCKVRFAKQRYEARKKRREGA